MIATSVSSFELIKVDRALEKRGLHRDMVTNITFQLDSLLEIRNQSLIFREEVSNNTYIYLEELKNKRKTFEFWPTEGLDIEKPSTVSTPQAFVWRLSFIDAISPPPNDYITSVEFLNGDLEPKADQTEMTKVEDIKKYPIFLKATIKYE